jgi:pyruvate dehydrogenase E2 component (dihydrolipoyllysine-residue acetyltransferase)
MAGTAVQEIAMPRLSDSMEEGTVLAWRKQVGEEVAVGEELVEIETDKANMGYEADVAGTLLEILVQENESAPVGAVIARIGEPGAELPASTPEPAPEQQPDPGPGAAPPAAASTSASGNGRVKASPLARRVASELGVDLASLSGSGPAGRIVKKDVEAAGTAPSPPGRSFSAPQAQEEQPGATETAKGTVETLEPTKLQQVVARRMAESKATAPHFYLTSEVEMSAAVAARARIKETSGEGEVVPSFNDMVVKACAIALRRFPRANGSYRDGRFELHSRVNVGIAVAASEALVVPTIFDADRKGLREIASDARSLAGRVRDGRVTPPELSGATFTVSNLGMFGIRSFAAIVNSPQAAILAVGEIAERPVVRDGEIVPGRVMELTLSCDHRILYGAEGAEFLAEVRRLLEEPIGLAL